MDFLDDTMRVDGQTDEEAIDGVSGFFSLGEPSRSVEHSEPEPSESSEPSEPLFLPADEEEEEIIEVPNPDAKRLSLSPEISRPTKKRRVSPSTSANKTDIAAADRIPNPKDEKPRYNNNNESFYIGEFLVDGAFSLVSGKNVIRSGQLIYLARDILQGSKQMQKELSEKKGAPLAKGKQTTLTTFITQPAVKPMKSVKKVDNIVRFTTETGLHLGRLPVAIANWVGKLIDFGLAHFVGTVVEAAERIRTGDSILLSLRAYLTPEAFQKPTTTDQDDVPKVFQEASETETEQNLRERKTSILKLFEIVGLKPRVAAPSLSLETMRTDATKETSDRPTKSKTKVRREIIGEGDDAEEIEVSDDEECLDDHDLNAIYKKAQSHDINMKEMEPAKTFALQLRFYQKQALYWLKSMEEGNQESRSNMSMHPLWQEFIFPIEPAVDGVIDLCDEEERPFYFNPYSGELSFEFPRSTEHSRGGILADEMGMGKTIQIASLIHTVKPTTSDERDGPLLGVKRKQISIDRSFKARLIESRGATSCRATLVIAPTSLLSQWAAELQRASKPGTLKVMVWHGSNRVNLESNIDGIDVLITSYGVLASEHGKHEGMRGNYRSPLYETVWFRVVIDEAHHAKSRVSRTAKACYALQAKRRWALTGTPIVNRLEDLQSLLHFLEFKPWSEYPFFRSFITIPFLSRDPKAIDIVQVILESILLRREKNMKDKDGNSILTLPPKTVTVETLEFSPLERKIYDQVYHNAKSTFKRFDAKGTVGKNWSSIFALLMRLRRAVLHPSLIMSTDTSADGKTKMDRSGEVNVDDLIANYMNGETKSGTGEYEHHSFAHVNLASFHQSAEQECPICYEPMDPPMLAPACMHSTCKDCMIDHLDQCLKRKEDGHCPICRKGPLHVQELVEVVRTKRKLKSSAMPDSSPEPEPADDSERDVIDVDADSNAGDGEERAVEPESDLREPSVEITFRLNNFQSSTKLDALMRDLRHLRDQDPAVKAIVFSQFTGFLDLIEVVLDRDNFPWIRLDGSMSEKQRTKVLKTFATPSEHPRIFIISLRAGGVGLNLTQANHVFMMDCWWNSAIEQQAIDRVHRLGQEREVFVKHFIVAHTVEKRVLAIQKRKTAIVSSALGKNSASTSEGLENLRIMFGEDEDDEF